MNEKKILKKAPALTHPLLSIRESKQSKRNKQKLYLTREVIKAKQEFVSLILSVLGLGVSGTLFASSLLEAIVSGDLVYGWAAFVFFILMVVIILLTYYYSVPKAKLSRVANLAFLINESKSVILNPKLAADYGTFEIAERISDLFSSNQDMVDTWKKRMQESASIYRLVNQETSAVYDSRDPKHILSCLVEYLILHWWNSRGKNLYIELLTGVSETETTDLPTGLQDNIVIDLVKSLKDGNSAELQPLEILSLNQSIECVVPKGHDMTFLSPIPFTGDTAGNAWPRNSGQLVISGKNFHIRCSYEICHVRNGLNTSPCNEKISYCYDILIPNNLTPMELNKYSHFSFSLSLEIEVKTWPRIRKSAIENLSIAEQMESSFMDFFDIDLQEDEILKRYGHCKYNIESYD